MSPSAIKNLLITSFFVVGTTVPAARAYATKYNYSLNFDARYGVHTYGSPDIATDRHTFEYEQKSEFNRNWSTVIGGRAEVEAAYASLPERYGVGDVAKYDSQSFFLRDNFIQYQNGSFRTRLGYQQVVWGEAFGFYYADIVNPKDYREAGLGDLARNRLDSPIVNLQWISAKSSLQLIYIPVPIFNILPRYGSDFNTLKLPAAYSKVPLTISRDPVSPVKSGEVGLRITEQISNYDLSLFYLNYNDRNPVFQMQTVAVPLSLTAVPDYKPLQTVGTTLTADFDGYLFRTEVLEHLNREINTLDGINLSSKKSNELVAVLGLDLPPMDKWIVAFQYSESRLDQANWAVRNSVQSIISARVAKTFSSEIGLELLATFFTSDSSRLTQADLSFPLSNQTELLFGADTFDGSESSELGRLKSASRVWVMFKASLKR